MGSYCTGIFEVVNEESSFNLVKHHNAAGSGWMAFSWQARRIIP